MSANFKKNRGYNLLEVMIALFVLAIGMLGMLKLQIQATRHNTTAYMYSQAGFFAQDILERMRANRSAVNQYLSAPVASPSKSCAGAAVDCTKEELAEWDLSEWNNQLTSALPQGESDIQLIGSNQSVQITIRFEDRRDQDSGVVTGVQQEYVLVTEL